MRRWMAVGDCASSPDSGHSGRIGSGRLAVYGASAARVVQRSASHSEPGRNRSRVGVGRRAGVRARRRLLPHYASTVGLRSSDADYEVPTVREPRGRRGDGRRTCGFTRVLERIRFGHLAPRSKRLRLHWHRNADARARSRGALWERPLLAEFVRSGTRTDDRRPWGALLLDLRRQHRRNGERNGHRRLNPPSDCRPRRWRTPSATCRRPWSGVPRPSRRPSCTRTRRYVQPCAQAAAEHSGPRRPYRGPGVVTAGNRHNRGPGDLATDGGGTSRHGRRPGNTHLPAGDGTSGCDH